MLVLYNPNLTEKGITLTFSVTICSVNISEMFSDRFNIHILPATIVASAFYLSFDFLCLCPVLVYFDSLPASSKVIELKI